MHEPSCWSQTIQETPLLNTYTTRPDRPHATHGPAAVDAYPSAFGSDRGNTAPVLGDAHQNHEALIAWFEGQCDIHA
jgi:hypothetical protein